MSGIAFDIQEIPVKLDTLDATDPVDRNLQGCRSLSAGIASVLRAIEAPGTGKFFRPTHIAAANQATYETYVGNAMSAVTDLLTALAAIAVQS